MADLRNFSIVRAGTVSLPNAPTWTISGQVVDVNYADQSKATVLADFTGANAVKFPQVLGQLTAAQQDDLVQMIVMYLLRAKGLIS